jgi:hypothetical protein
MSAKIKYKKRILKTNAMLLDDFAKITTKIREDLKEKGKHQVHEEHWLKLMDVLEDYEEHYGIKERK